MTHKFNKMKNNQNQYFSGNQPLENSKIHILKAGFNSFILIIIANNFRF